mmetsp:Transcript_29906/g.49068  ORF Transcript_29906/g.49068 Transcript_29906/m.49068 type:complete len:82 (-) Transcript_29906:330-575(-)
MWKELMALHQRRVGYARLMHAPTRSRKEDFLLCMEQSRNHAVWKDAPFVYGKEDTAVGMGKSQNLAAMKDAKILPSKWESV